MQGYLHFRIYAEPGGDETRRRWRATYSHPDGLSAFQVLLDLARNTCTFRRGEHDCSLMLLDLTKALVGEGAPAPRVTSRVESLDFDIELLGLKMSRSATGEVGPAAEPPAFNMDPPGDWLVVRAYVPGGTQSFCFAVSDRQGSAEIVADQPSSGPAVVRVLAQVLG